MRTIETTALVTDDGKLVVPVPPDISPGAYRVVVEIGEKAEPSPGQAPKPPLKLNVFKWEAWPADFTFRREDLYGEEGR